MCFVLMKDKTHTQKIEYIIMVICTIRILYSCISSLASYKADLKKSAHSTQLLCESMPWVVLMPTSTSSFPRLLMHMSILHPYEYTPGFG